MRSRILFGIGIEWTQVAERQGRAAASVEQVISTMGMRKRSHDPFDRPQNYFVTIRARGGITVHRPVSEFAQDLKFGCRTLWKSRGFTVVALATLAIGIGGNAAIFSFVNAVLLKPLPYDHPERIVRVLEQPPGGGTNGISTLTLGLG